jgi:ABC-type branched-subunit amino acid transport system substrate-binding protein
LAREAEKRAAEDAKQAAEHARLAAIAATQAAENSAMAAADEENLLFAAVWSLEVAAAAQRRRERSENDAMAAAEEWCRDLWAAQTAYVAEQARLEAARLVICALTSHSTRAPSVGLASCSTCS